MGDEEFIRDLRRGMAAKNVTVPVEVRPSQTTVPLAEVRQRQKAELASGGAENPQFPTPNVQKANEIKPPVVVPRVGGKPTESEGHAMQACDDGKSTLGVQCGIRRGRPPDTGRNAEMLAMREVGRTNREIADYWGVTAERVRQIIGTPERKAKPPPPSLTETQQAARELGKPGGQVGGPAMDKALTPERRSEIARPQRMPRRFNP